MPCDTKLHLLIKKNIILEISQPAPDHMKLNSYPHFDNSAVFSSNKIQIAR